MLASPPCAGEPSSRPGAAAVSRAARAWPSSSPSSTPFPSASYIATSCAENRPDGPPTAPSAASLAASASRSSASLLTPRASRTGATIWFKPCGCKSQASTSLCTVRAWVCSFHNAAWLPTSRTRPSGSKAPRSMRRMLLKCLTSPRALGRSRQRSSRNAGGRRHSRQPAARPRQVSAPWQLRRSGAHLCWQLLATEIANFTGQTEQRYEVPVSFWTQLVRSS
mmetsp:Transcript_35898/g.99527  ORF Transcript_35898/g.99527 Transcript_35898/m.99527 type:complete len:223 (-) Transcript_35898:356-1024(-)